MGTSASVQGMKRPLDKTMLAKEIEGVRAKLSTTAVSGEKRLAALRRQAQLGDLRDAIDERERRAAQ